MLVTYIFTRATLVQCSHQLSMSMGLAPIMELLEHSIVASLIEDTVFTQTILSLKGGRTNTGHADVFLN